MSHNHDRFAREAREQYGPALTTPTEALAHVLAVHAETADDRVVLQATSGIYGPGVRTGLATGDLRALADRDARLTEFARRIVALDDVDGPGAKERRTVTLTRIIGWAQAALGETTA